MPDPAAVVVVVVVIVAVVVGVFVLRAGSMSPGLCIEMASARRACCSGVMSLKAFETELDAGVVVKVRRCSTLAGAGRPVSGTGPPAVGAFGSFELACGVFGAIAEWMGDAVGRICSRVYYVCRESTASVRVCACVYVCVARWPRGTEKQINKEAGIQGKQNGMMVQLKED